MRSIKLHDGKKALLSDEALHYEKAIQKELKSLEEHDVFMRATPEPGAQILRSFFILSKKKNGIYKARLVANGNSQREEDISTYAPVVGLESLRVLIAFIVRFDLLFFASDVRTAFLYGDLDPSEKPIYIRVPSGFESHFGGDFLLLRKALYGLKNAPRRWCQRLVSVLQKLGFKRLLFDRCIFILIETRGVIILATWVDDLPAGASSVNLWEWFMEKLKSYFDITGGDEECSEIIGIKVAREADGSIVLSAPAFIKNLLEAQGLGSANGSRYPDDKSTVPAGRVLDSKETSNYRAVVGSLRWLERTTFPVLAHAVNTASRFLQKPHSGNWIAVKRILRFLANKQHMGLYFRANRSSLPVQSLPYVYFDRSVLGFGDSNLGDHVTPRSKSGRMNLVLGCPVDWGTKMQATTADSTGSAEYIAISEEAKTALWLRNLVGEIAGILGVVKPDGSLSIGKISTQQRQRQTGEKEVELEPALVYGDNQSAVINLQDPNNFGKSTRHLARRYHLVKDNVENGSLEIRKVNTEENLADAFTKPAVQKSFEYHQQMIMK